MAFRKGTMGVATSTGLDHLPMLQGSQLINLMSYNVGAGGNDVQITAVLEQYKIDAKNFFESPSQTL
jgi:hypothetical protein